MRTALVTTTINVPTVLKLFQHNHALNRVNDPAFFVAGDLKTPSEAEAFCKTIPNCFYLSPKKQDEWKCSALIPFNCIQRRNIAILEALKWGADIIILCDDDNASIARGSYFDTFFDIITTPFDGLQVGSGGWFDYGRWQFPVEGAPVSQRGMPYVEQDDYVGHVVGAQIGVAQGICLGDPDTSAIDRIARRPVIHQVSELLREGVVVHPDTKTVFNSQNSAILRELVPAFFLAPYLGRNDDIYGSLICRRIMRERGLYLHVGKPFVYQQRNEHDLLRDLAAEMYGMERIMAFTALLDGLYLSEGPVLAQARQIWAGMSHARILPAQSCEAASAFLDDCDKAMA